MFTCFLFCTVFDRIFDRIGFNQIPESLFRDLVISRITHPGSKLKLVEYLHESKGQEISVYSIYRYMDKINARYKEQVEQIAFNHTKRVLENKISIVFYDIFEGNIFEGHTLIPVLEHFQEKFELSRPVVIADAGLLSKENIAGLKEKGYQYILGTKPKNEADE